MHDGDILILKGSEINSLLAGRELDLIRTVRSAYQAHACGESSLPHSTFLWFPHNQRNRIMVWEQLSPHIYQSLGVRLIDVVTATQAHDRR
jgi:hypothetical protein